MAWIRKCLWKSPCHEPHNFSLKNTGNLTLPLSYRSLTIQIHELFSWWREEFLYFLHLMNGRRSSSLNCCGHTISVLAPLTALLHVTSELLCFRALCAENSSVLGNIHQKNQKLWNSVFLVFWSVDNTVRCFCCSLGRNHRCDPGNTYLEQRLHCTFMWVAAERNRVFPPLWYTAADPVKSQLLKAVPVQTDSASFLQSFRALNSLNNLKLKSCSSYITVSVLT